MNQRILDSVKAYDSSVDQVSVLRVLGKTHTSAQLAEKFHIPPTTMSRFCRKYGVKCVQIDHVTRGKLGYAKAQANRACMQ